MMTGDIHKSHLMASSKHCLPLSSAVGEEVDEIEHQGALESGLGET